MDKIWLKAYPPGVPADIDPDQYGSLVELLEESFRKYAANNAFVCMDKFLTYGELDNMSKRLAAWLQSRGMKPGARVAVMMPNVLQYPVALAAILRAGYAVVNVNPLYTPRELEHQLKDSGSEAIVVLENFAHTVQQVLGKTPVRHVVGTDGHGLHRSARALVERLVETHRARQAVVGHHLLDVAHHVVDERALQEAEAVAHGGQHDVLDRRGRDALLQRGAEVLHDDDGLRARVLELMLEFARRVQRVHVDQDQAGAQDARDRDRVLRAVGHHHGHTVALGQAQALQVRGEGLAPLVGFRVADVLAHEAVGRAVRVLREALFHERDQRRVLRGIDIGGHTLRVAAEPRTIGHLFCLLRESDS